MRIPVPPPFRSLVENLDMHGGRLEQVLATGVSATPGGRYRHWATLRHLTPPQGLTREEWWLGIKFARISAARPLPLEDAEGSPFTYSTPDVALQMLHEIDQRAAGNIGIPEVVATPGTRDRYLINSLMDEAITSSQLEGANTSYPVAKQMLRSGRDPRDLGERMIVNNYRAMQLIRERRDDELTPELVYEIHRLVTGGTLDDPSQAGRPQQPGEDRVRVYDQFGQILHEPPAAEQLPKRMMELCRFANGENSGGFIHPVVRAILIHFWLSYDHPFTDGNGRTARILFYWAMLHQGYWLCEFLSVSSIINKAPARYGRAFLYSETDDLDSSYFVLFNLKVICRSIKLLFEYLGRKSHEIAQAERLFERSAFNYRQIALVSHALRHPDASYTFKSHGSAHRVVHQTARTDLLALEKNGFLRRARRGRALVFYPIENLGERALTDNGRDGATAAQVG